MNYKPYGILLDGVPSVLPPFQENGLWTVNDTVRYITRDGYKVTMHKGETSDLASIPRPFRIFFGGDGKEAVAALFHDHIYRRQWKERDNIELDEPDAKLSWRQANMVMHDLMILAGTGFMRRNSIMAGLWAGSYPVWLRYKYQAVVEK